jgi:hypothetical protein
MPVGVAEPCHGLNLRLGKTVVGLVFVLTSSFDQKASESCLLVVVGLIPLRPQHNMTGLPWMHTNTLVASAIRVLRAANEKRYS